MFPAQGPAAEETKTPEQKEKEEKAKAEEAAESAEARKDVMIIMACIFAILFVVSGLMVSFPIPPTSVTDISHSFLSQLGAAWYLGARFDLAFSDVKEGHLTPPKPSLEDHVEL